MARSFTPIFLPLFFALLCSKTALSQRGVLVNFGDNSCSAPATPSFSLIKDPLTATPVVLTNCSMAAQLPDFYSTFIAYNPENSRIFIADIRSGVTKIWSLDMGLSGNIICPAIPVSPNYSYNYIANNFEFDNAGNLWSFSAFNGPAGQCKIDKINVVNGNIFNTRTLQFPAGNYPSDISSGDLCILPNGRMFAVLGTGPSRLYEITDYTGISATATFLQAMPQSCYGIAYVNGQLELTGFSSSCYRYLYDIAAHTLSTSSAFQNGQTPIDNTSFSPTIGATKQLQNVVFIGPNSAKFIYEIYLQNMGNVRLSNISLKDDLGAVFGAANIYNVSAAIPFGANAAGLVLNPNYNGITDTELLSPGGTLTNLIDANQDYYAKIQIQLTVNNLQPNTLYLNSAIASGSIGNAANSTLIIVSDSSNNGNQSMLDPNNNGIAGDAGENIPTPFFFGVLPVKFLNITASPENKNDAIVRWSVATPTIDADYFEPEYSTDGVHFTSFGHIKITDRNRANYDKLHLNVPAGIIFYRVKQVDNDGTYIYSKTVVLRTGKGSDVYTVYPSPANSYFNIVSPSSSRNATAALYDATGRLLLSTSLLSSQQQINCSNFPPGTYLLKIQDHAGVVAQKVLIQR